MTELSTPSAEGRGEWLRPLVGIAAAMVVLAIVSTTAVVLVGGTPKPTVAYPAGSPQAAFQKFAVAVQAGDYSTADTYLSSRVRQEGISSYTFGGPSTGTPSGDLSILSAQIDGDAATLGVSYTYYSSSAFGNSYQNGTQQTVQMVRENGDWKVDTELTPASL